MKLSEVSAESITWRIAKTTYVMLLKDDTGRLTLLVDPGLNRPWSTKNKRHADVVASECGGMTATFEEAFKLLLKENPDFEKVLHDRINKKTKQVSANIFSHGQPANLTVPRNDVNPINPAF